MMLGKFLKAVPLADVPTPFRMPADSFALADLGRRARAENEAAIRARCQCSYLGDHKALCRVLGCYKMFIDTRDAGLAPHLMLDGFWEMWLTETLAALIRPGMVVADIGANLGYFTLLMADLVGPAGLVHAFEPNPQMAELLQRSVSINGFGDRARVHQVALAAEDGGEAALVVPPDDPKNARMVAMGEVVATGANAPIHAVPVPVARLDGQADWAAIELAKIDVEGAEPLLWAGARGLLESGRLRTVLLEFEAHRTPNPAEFLAALTAPGFALAWLDPERGIVDVSAADVLERDPHQDSMLVLRR